MAGVAYLYKMEIEATFICLYCHQANVTMVDVSGGLQQEYIEDCQVCCQPNMLCVTINRTLEEAEIRPEMP